MKRSTYSISCALIMTMSALLFHSCQQDSSIEILEEEDYQKKIESYEQKIQNLEKKIAQNTSRRPKNIINLSLAQKIYKNYDKRAELISNTTDPTTDGIPFESTRSLFYEFSELESYISYVKKLSEKAGVTPTGVRFYFALYPDYHITSDGSTANSRRQTIFIAPTTETSNGENIGYTLNNDFKVIFLDRENGFYSTNNKNIIDFSKGGDGDGDDDYSLIANEFESSPPN